MPEKHGLGFAFHAPADKPMITSRLCLAHYIRASNRNKTVPKSACSRTPIWRNVQMSTSGACVWDEKQSCLPVPLPFCAHSCSVPFTGNQSADH